ncbi:DUF4962 domain-containing protein [Dysgonomonas sp. 520]|nr:DUF4962 domain-containing protein [Dysgonomonas sp. 520]
MMIFVAQPIAAQMEAEKSITKRAIHPRYREWSTPANGVEVKTNSPSMLWPAAEKPVKYRVRLSQSEKFPTSSTITSQPIEWAAYSHHKKLPSGKWYWQYSTIKGGTETWSETFSFVIGKNSRIFETPTIDEFIRICKQKSHFRLYVTESELSAFQSRNKNNKEALALIKRADKQLTADLIQEAPTRPRDTTGLTESEKKVMEVFMYHGFGDKVKEPIKDLSMAYLLTGKEEYARTAIKQALHISKMNPKGSATNDDFNSSSAMLAMAVAFDTGFKFLTENEKKQLLEAIKQRGDHFFNHYANKFETHSMDNHVWQHTFRRFFMTSIAMLGDLPEADKWLSYCYEIWNCRFPILSGDDGGWHDGNSYFQVNFETFIYVPFMLTRLTGTDFFDIPYYKNLSKYLIYSFPPDSYATGFGDNAENMKKPTKNYWGMADALAREVNDPYARWYADVLTEGKDENLFRSTNFTFYRLMTNKKKTSVTARSPKELPQSLLFRDAGFALMHDDVTDTSKDVMVSFMALPFGATGHAHAAHNGFGINVGGKQMFGGSGHYSNFTDTHTLKHYRTRGHNTILADGMAQVIGENGYGWIARFANTDNLTYVLGDATHAYDDMTSDFWIERMKQFEVDYTLKNGFGNPHIERFRRHMAFLRPNVIIIYDELEAQNPVKWTWLLHSYNQMTKGDKENTIFGQNRVAESRVDIFTPKKLTTEITNEFFSPAINWKNRGGDSNGKGAYEYSKHWHAEVNTIEKSKGIRFLSVIQIKEDGTTESLIAPDYKSGKIKLSDWQIAAEMDENKPASLVIKNNEGDAIEYNTQQSKIKGSTLIKAKGNVINELIDELPDAAK